MDKNEKRLERISIMEKLYSYDLSGEFVLLKEIEGREYVVNIVNYVSTHLENIDEIISKSLTKYHISRLSYVDRAIARMVVAEICFDLPVSIAINEALEIIKEYSDQGDGMNVRFMNRLLDNICKTMGK